MRARTLILFFVGTILLWSVPDGVSAAKVFYSQIDASVQSTVAPVSNSGVGQIFTPTISGNATTIAIRTVPGGNGFVDCSRTIEDPFKTTNPMQIAIWPINATSSKPVSGSYARFTASSTVPDANGNCFYNYTDGFGVLANGTLVAGSPYMVAFDDLILRWRGDFFGGSSSGTGTGYFNWIKTSDYDPLSGANFIPGNVGVASYFMTISDTKNFISDRNVGIGGIATSTPPDSCASGGCVSNVLFLPGIEASRLYRPDYNGGTDQLWEPNTSGDAEDLFLTADGKSIRNDVYTKDVVDEKNVSPIGQGNIYKSFIAQMDDLRRAGTIVDWRAAPYDWRLSLDDILGNGTQLPDGRIYYSGDFAATSSPFIIQELRRLAASSKTEKVTIVAHSNGGLIAKVLTNKLGGEASALIDKIIFVAVPQTGTPQAVGAILHGYDQGLPFDFLPLVLTPETARSLAINMPSAYNLLPSTDYFARVGDPVVMFDDSDFLAEFRSRYGSAIRDSAQLRDFVNDTRRLASSSPGDLKYPSVGNTTLLSRAETLHSVLDSWTPPQGVSFYEIAGWGEDTLATIEYKEGRKARCSNPLNIFSCSIVPAITYNPKEVIDGDGTVVVPSAFGTSVSAAERYWVDLNGYNDNHINRKHADILEIPSLRALVQNILTNSTSTHLDFISTSQPIARQPDERLRFVLHSPLNLSATDSLGNTVNSTTSAIPGGRFKRYGEVQVLTVPKNTPLTLNLDGYASGSFTLDMQEINGNNSVIASSSFSAIPSATSTTASMTFADGTLQNASPLLLDYDGNGVTDLSLQSKIGEEVVFDTTPPEAVISFDPISQMLKISGTDDLSSTTVRNTATSTTIADEAGNTLLIVFKKFKQEGKELKLELQELRYNGVSAGEVPKTILQYEWSTDKLGKLKTLEEKASTGGRAIEGHYDAKKNVTRIEEKEKARKGKGEKESKKTFPGLTVFSLSTNRGEVDVSY